MTAILFDTPSEWALFILLLHALAWGIAQYRLKKQYKADYADLQTRMYAVVYPNTGAASPAPSSSPVTAPVAVPKRVTENLFVEAESQRYFTVISYDADPAYFLKTRCPYCHHWFVPHFRPMPNPSHNTYPVDLLVASFDGYTCPTPSCKKPYHLVRADSRIVYWLGYKPASS